MSKGSRQRPRQVSNEEYANRWNEIFGKHKDEHKDEHQDDENQDQPKENDDHSRPISRDSGVSRIR